MCLLPAHARALSHLVSAHLISSRLLLRLHLWQVADALAEVEKTGVLKVVGSLSLYMMRLGEEYTKSLQSINPHTQEYIRRLKDESVVVELAAKVQAYYERQGEMSTAADLALLQVRAEQGLCAVG